MSNGKKATAVAVNDFVKTNGSDPAEHLVLTVGPSLTRQEFLEECDINTLMKRYEGHATGPGGLPNARQEMPFYADFSEMPSNLLDYLTMVKDAENAFMTLPASVRREFDNDAIAFVDFASDPNNVDQMRAWGLAKPLPPAPVEPPAAPSSPAGSAPPSGSTPPGGASTHVTT